MSLLFKLSLASVAATALACGGTDGAGFDSGVLPGDNHDADLMGDVAFTGDGAGPSLGPGFFYANSDTTLYTLNPKQIMAPAVKVGDFDCVPSQTTVMTDVAVDKNGNLFGVSTSAAWPLTIQNGVVHCETKWPLPQNTHFNGLTVAPENTVDTKEVLIGGNQTGEVYRIDAITGNVTQVGTLGIDPVSGRAWGVSGDMVFMANNGNPIGFASLRTCSTPTSCDLTDTLAEIDVTKVKPGTQSIIKSLRGPIVKGAQCQNAASPKTFGSIFGVVALGTEVYGFSRRGDFVDVANNDGSGCLLWADATIKFAGAAITTVAPVVAPPPK
jgi:hypothetical protein